MAARYSAKVNGLTGIALTKLDILNSFETIKVCTTYNLNDKRTEHMTEALNELQNVQPIYKEFKGWNIDIADIDNFDELPNEAKDYIQYLESEIGVPISMISIGPKRHQIIHHKK